MNNGSPSTAGAPPVFNVFDPEFRANPYPTYERFRTEDPVHAMYGGAWLLTRYEDVARWIRDDRKLVKDQAKMLSLYPPGPFRDYAGHMMFYMGAPEYPRLRGAVATSFAQTAVGPWEGLVARIVEETMDGLAGREQFDLVSEFAEPIAFAVMTELFGLPAADRPLLTRLANNLVKVFEPVYSPEDLAAADQTALEYREYFGGWAERRRREPGPDFISAMVRNQAAYRVTDEEIISNVSFLTVAGAATSALTIGSSAHALCTQPELAQELREHPELMDNAVEEMVRLFTPGHLVQRFATEDLIFGDRTIPAGAPVTVCLAAANHDPARFENPDRVDLHRPARENKHVSFGAGLHFCIGAQLARMEIGASLGGLLHRFRDLELRQPAVGLGALAFQGFREAIVSTGAI